MNSHKHGRCWGDVTTDTLSITASIRTSSNGCTKHQLCGNSTYQPSWATWMMMDGECLERKCTTQHKVHGHRRQTSIHAHSPSLYISLSVLLNCWCFQEPTWLFYFQFLSRKCLKFQAQWCRSSLHLFSFPSNTIKWNEEKLIGEREGKSGGKCWALLTKWIFIQSDTTNKWPPPWSS